MTWVPWAIVSGLVLEVISTWIARHAVHVAEYERHPRFRLWQHGTRGPAHERRWFFLLKLPSYQMRISDYGRGPTEWYQLVLIWESGRGWRQSGYWPE